ncbi:MAG: hypothetical protein QXT73_00745 [Candidatus Methanomethylicaceae archaeon]
MSGRPHHVRVIFACSQCNHTFSMVFRGKYFDILQQIDTIKCFFCGHTAPELEKFDELHLEHLREYVVWV